MEKDWAAGGADVQEAEEGAAPWALKGIAHSGIIAKAIASRAPHWFLLNIVSLLLLVVFKTAPESSTEFRAAFRSRGSRREIRSETPVCQIEPIRRCLCRQAADRDCSNWR